MSRVRLSDHEARHRGDYGALDEVQETFPAENASGELLDELVLHVCLPGLSGRLDQRASKWVGNARRGSR